MRKRDGTPIWIDEGRMESFPLGRADLRGGAEGYDEAWLQDLLHRRPMVLPVEQIEPGFGDLVPMCKELPLAFGAGRSGALDNIFLTAAGGLVLIEAKLWRNPEARRTVVAQAMEYAAAVFKLSYEGLETAVLRARRAAGERGGTSLYEIVAAAFPNVDESEFVDAVSRNLTRGRAIVAVVGDGIREDIAPLAELLQSHAGHRFTFALVELAVFEAPHGGVRIVAPSILAQTRLIERGVVRIEESASGAGRIVVEEDEAAPTPASNAPKRAFGIGEDEFFELLELREPGLASMFKSFLAKADAIGIYADLRGGLNLKHAAPSGNPLNLGTIRKDGYIDMFGREEIGRTYNETVAGLIGGKVTEDESGKWSGVRTTGGKMPRLSSLLPAHEEAWLAAIERYVRDAFDDTRQISRP